MSRNYKLLEGPVTEPVSLITAKLHLRVDFATDDSLISMYITAARQLAEQKINKPIYNQTYQLNLDTFPYGDWRSTRPISVNRDPYGYSAYYGGLAVKLPKPRCQSVTSITYVDGTGTTQTLDPAFYQVYLNSEPARIVPTNGSSWPTTDLYLPGTITITFEAGNYGDGVEVDTCPMPIKMAILLLVGHLYENREASGANTLAAIPLGVDALLAPYRFHTFTYGDC